MTENTENQASEEQTTSDAEIDEDRSGFLMHFREIWSETVGNYATDEGETRNLFSRFVDFGTLSREEARKLFSEASEKIEQNRSEFDARIDENIKRATSRLSPIPMDEMKKLNEKLSDIETRITALEGEKN